VGCVVRMAEATRDRASQAHQLLQHGVQLAHPRPRAKAAVLCGRMDHANSPRTWPATRAAAERPRSGPPARTACAGRRKALLPQPHARVPRSDQRSCPPPLGGTQPCGPHAPALWCQRVPPRIPPTNHPFPRITLCTTMRNAYTLASSDEPRRAWASRLRWKREDVDGT
jgi:hypothetical protein